jgi:biotin synthase
MEVCTTLGMVNKEQAQRLAEAGVTAYNHNIDTSPKHYEKIISTRLFQDRLRTLESVRSAGMRVCCGGIVGMGETLEDRAAMLVVLANMNPPPESVPINQLVPSPGTPLADQKKIDIFDYLRSIAVARIMMPTSRIRLAAGRGGLSDEGQALAFLLGANSIFFGEELLTTPNPEMSEDMQLLDRLGMTSETLIETQSRF